MLSKIKFQRKKNIPGLCLCLLWLNWANISGAREIAISILHTADIHGCLESVTPEGSDKPAGLPAVPSAQPMPARNATHSVAGGQAGGLLRCAAEINKIRAQESNVVLIDCGDFIQGSVESYLTGGEIMMKAAGYLRYDALVVGNHEFDWGVERLGALYRKAEIPLLTAGIEAPANTSLLKGRPFLVKDIDGVKLVIVGLTNPLIPMWQRPRLLGGLTFPQSLEALRGVLAEARKIKPDILVLAVHQGWRQWGDDFANNINGIAKAFPDFDLIIGAHTHQAVEAREVNRVIYTQAGDHGLWLGKVSLKYDDKQRRLTKIEPRLIAIGADMLPDPDMEKLTADSIRSAKSYLGRKIGENKRELAADSEKGGQSGVQTLISAAIAESVNADIVFHGTLSPAGLWVGIVRMRDVWRIVPYENTIGKAWLTFDEMREILEENSRYYGKSQFRGVYGITYEINPRAPLGERVSNLRLGNGRVIKGDERISFAVNSYDLASAGGRFPRLREVMERTGCRLEETDKDTREAVVEYIEKHSPLNIEVAPGAIVKRSKQKSEVRNPEKNNN